MNGNKIHPIIKVFFDPGKDVVNSHIDNGLAFFHHGVASGLIKWNGTNTDIGFCDYCGTNFVNRPPRGEIHDRIGTGIYRNACFF